MKEIKYKFTYDFIKFNIKEKYIYLKHNQNLLFQCFQNIA